MEFTEQIQYDAPAVQQTPLVQEGGRLVVTDRRLYFQPLHNVAGGNPVRSHPLAAVAAIAHRNSSLRPIGNLHVYCIKTYLQAHCLQRVLFIFDFSSIAITAHLACEVR